MPEYNHLFVENIGFDSVFVISCGLLLLYVIKQSIFGPKNYDEE